MIQRNTEAIGPLSASMKIFPVLGNHDAFPKSQFSPDQTDELYQQVGDIWMDFLLPVEAYESFKTQGTVLVIVPEKRFRLFHHF
jgi:hypothetical protein